ncbi:hypothetical protein D3C71_1348280 [compost metagenome]
MAIIIPLISIHIMAGRVCFVFPSQPMPVLISKAIFSLMLFSELNIHNIRWQISKNGNKVPRRDIVLLIGMIIFSKLAHKLISRVMSVVGPKKLIIT